jgi:hypothetical protein
VALAFSRRHAQGDWGIVPDGALTHYRDEQGERATCSSVRSERRASSRPAERGSRATLTVEEERQFRKNRQLTDELGATIVRLRGTMVDEVVAYVWAHNLATVAIDHLQAAP